MPVVRLKIPDIFSCGAGWGPGEGVEVQGVGCTQPTLSRDQVWAQGPTARAYAYPRRHNNVGASGGRARGNAEPAVEDPT